MLENLIHKHQRLAGGNIQRIFIRYFTEYLRNTFVNRIFKKPYGAESLAIPAHAFCRSISAYQFRKIFYERWANAPLQRVLARHGLTHLPQRVLHAAGNPFLGVGQGAVEVKKNCLYGPQIRSFLHGC